MFSFFVLLYLGELIFQHGAELVPYKIESQLNIHENIPLIVVRLVVPDFWSHIVWCPDICMSVGL